MYVPVPSPRGSPNRTARCTIADSIAVVPGSVDPSYFGPRKLPNFEIKDQDYWLPKWQNIKQLHKDVITYLRDEGTQTLSLDEATLPNTKAIAMVQADYTPEVIKLLKVILVAAVYSPRANEFLQRMPSLTFETQAAIKSIIEEMSDDGTRVSETVSPTDEDGPGPRATPSAVATDLQMEERFGKVIAENQGLAQDRRDLQQEVAELHHRLARLQDNNDVLQDRLTAAEDKLKVNGAAGKGFGDDATAAMRRLEARIQDQEDMIAHDEVKIAQLQTEREEQDKTIESLRVTSSNALRLQDELDEIRIERDNLAKKANALDKYRQKLQATQELEGENRELRSEIEELRLQLQQVDEDRQRSHGLELTVDQYRRTIEKVEQDYSELQTMKRRLELDNAHLADRVENAAERQARDGETIAELQEKVRELDTGTLPAHDANGSLEHELSYSAKSKADLRAEIASLRAEIGTIKAGSESEAQNVMLANLLQDAKKKMAALETKYLDTYQAQLVAESQLDTLTRGKPTEG